MKTISLLIVIDELLEYLQESTLTVFSDALMMLRQMGEMCDNHSFRYHQENTF
jgi:hypothetical protein